MIVNIISQLSHLSLRKLFLKRFSLAITRKKTTIQRYFTLHTMNMTNYYTRSLEEHKKYKGKVEMISRVPLNTREDMSTYYSPGVAQPCLEIEKNPELAYDYTWKGRSIAVVSDGSAVLGLGNI